MSNWQQWIEPEEGHRAKTKKPNKNVFCRKNKMGNNRYGYHEYDENQIECKYCGHVKDKRNINIQEKDNEQRSDE